jgi:tRNA(Ile)-lysidine synthase
VVKQFLNHIQRHNLCKITDKILLAVSGGVDSVTMFHLFREAGFRIGVAHCNFQLRKGDAMADESFVEGLCRQHDVPCFVKRFNTKAYAEEQGISIQMAARDLRYEFFKSIRLKEEFDYVSTAHHIDDSLETVLINLTRGTGLDGLTGVPVKNEFIIRPLLFASRQMILENASIKKISWREDQSNSSDDYQRNSLRHQVIPKLKEINPNLEQTFSSTLAKISGAQQIIDATVEAFKTVSVTIAGNDIQIDYTKLLHTVSPETILYSLIREYGFNYSQCQEIIKSHQTGSSFLTRSHQLLIDRNVLLISPIKERTLDEIEIEELDQDHEVQNGISKLIFQRSKDTKILKSSSDVIKVDISKLKFPLVWRRWNAGDSFRPFGMKGFKKVSDFLIDEKISLKEKQDVSVLLSDGKIIWVAGYRLDDRYRIDVNTVEVLRIKMEKLTA